MKITLDLITLQVIFQTISHEAGCGSRNWCYVPNKPLCIFMVFYTGFLKSSRENLQSCELLLDSQVNPSTGHRLSHQAQHFQQQKKGWDWPHPVLRGTFLAAARSREMLVWIFRTEHLSFVTLLSLRTAFRDAGKPPGPSCFGSHCDLLWFLLNCG